MFRYSMKLTASVIGSLALVFAAACEERTTTAPDQVNAPSATAPGTPTHVDALNPPGSVPAASEVSPDEAQPVSGTDEEPMGGGGHAGSGGAGGHGHGHGGKTSH